MILPGQLNAAVARWMDTNGQGSLTDDARRLSAAYRQGGNSSKVSLAAYMATRLPATFAANRKVLGALADAMPDFAPSSLLDVGTGPGTATWAALAQWPSISSIAQWEQDVGFARLARALNAESELPALVASSVEERKLQSLTAGMKADMVMASYVLAELPLEQMRSLAELMWQAAAQVLVVIEPGTPQGFARLRVMRSHLLARGAYVAAPCTHHAQCPMAGNDWCHFKVRVQRSRAHMHAKQATVPFEDEPYSYLVLSRQKIAPGGSRVIGPPLVAKPGITLPLCKAEGLSTPVIASRDKALYKRAKRMVWGDTWPGGTDP